MEAILAILVVLGVLPAGDKPPEQSLDTVNQEVPTSSPETSDREIALICDEQESVYRDFTMPVVPSVEREAAGNTETTHDE